MLTRASLPASLSAMVEVTWETVKQGKYRKIFCPAKPHFQTHEGASCEP
jgi:hypothetical protein